MKNDKISTSKTKISDTQSNLSELNIQMDAIKKSLKKKQNDSELLEKHLRVNNSDFEHCRVSNAYFYVGFFLCPFYLRTIVKVSKKFARKSFICRKSWRIWTKTIRLRRPIATSQSSTNRNKRTCSKSKTSRTNSTRTSTQYACKSNLSSTKSIRSKTKCPIWTRKMIILIPCLLSNAMISSSNIRAWHCHRLWISFLARIDLQRQKVSRSSSQ